MSTVFNFTFVPWFRSVAAVEGHVRPSYQGGVSTLDSSASGCACCSSRRVSMV